MRLRSITVVWYLIKCQYCCILSPKLIQMASAQFITLSEAIDLTTKFREQKDEILSSTYQGSAVLPTCETFECDAVRTLMGQDACTSLRVYFGMDENKQIKLVLVGVNGSNTDILPASSSATAIILEKGVRCPVDCPPASVLNS
jgi:hypothetical protein